MQRRRIVVYSPLEVVSKSILPSLKSAVVRRLIHEGMSEAGAAKAVGVSQSAVSRYLSGERGRLFGALDVAPMDSLLDELVKTIMTQKPSPETVLHEMDKLAVAALSSGYVCGVCLARNTGFARSCRVCVDDPIQVHWLGETLESPPKGTRWFTEKSGSLN
jgi:predicted transcriptional regulator